MSSAHADSPHWLRHFADAGYPRVRSLAAGAEGAVYRLDDATVAKVWDRRRAAELRRSQRFYADVARAGLPFATPVIHRVDEVDGVALTIERHLPGVPLQGWLSPADRDVGAAVTDCLVQVLHALRRVPGTPAMRQLPVLDEQRPFWTGADDFRAALIALLRRRVARFGDLLRAHVHDFDHRYDRLLSRLARLDPVPPTVVHGDLFGENVLVDSGVRPVAVLDFGFLATCGDPRLDAAISAMTMNMYGPAAPAVTESLTVRLAGGLGYPIEELLILQAAYAVATSNAFTVDGTDGHFPWCVSQLTRQTVTTALNA